MSRRSSPIAVTLLFLSGFTGLVYELAWSKRLANLLGNTGQAHAIVLATFMGGLACGAWLFGRTADRAKRPLVVYGVLELGVGVCALLFPWLLDALGAVYLELAPGLDGTRRTTARLVLAAATLLVPTLLMGGSVPAMTRHVTERLGAARRSLALLYAVNSLGAALGCLLAGMVLVPVKGLWATERAAALLNLCLGLAALLVGRRIPPPVAQPEVEAEPPRVFGPLAVRAALVGTALAGFTAMLYELTWIRVLSVVIGGTSYAFTLILTSFIFGIALGSFWLATRAESDALTLLGRLQAWLVLAVCLTMPFYARLPYVFIQLSKMLQHGPQTWVVYQALTFVFCGAVLIAPTFLLGAIFPSAARVAMSSVEKVGGQLGGVYLWNTIGTVLGSLLGGLWLLPAIGLEGNFLVGLGCNLAATAVALHAAREPAQSWGRALWPVVAGALVVALTASGTRGWTTQVAAAGRAREWSFDLDDYAQFEHLVATTSRVLSYQDDVFASVLVGESTRDDGSTHRFLRINGKVDASNSTDMDVQVMMAQLGMLLHPREVKRVLVIGAGSGVSVGSLLTHPVERVDVAEISTAVIDATKLFEKENRRALADPRTRVHVEDARTFLALSHEKYDLIISEPSNPWVSGVAGLYTRDFFRVAKEHLADDGLMVQWIHTYESSDAMLKLVVRTLRDSFEHGTTWLGPLDLLLVAGRQPQTWDPEAIRARMDRPEVKELLAAAHLREVPTLLARQLQSDEAQKAWAGTGPVNTDDLNLLEYGSPIAYFVAANVNVGDERTGPEQGRRLALTAYLAQHPLTAAQARDLHDNLAWVHRPGDAVVRSSAETWLRLDPESIEAAVAVATAALEQRDAHAVDAVLGPLIARGERSPAVVTPWLRAQRAGRAHGGGPWVPVDVSAAVALGREVAKANPTDGKLREALERLEGERPTTP